ncbi:MAG: alpha/beta hydrolase fold domain-containing protein, partial [Actinomycetota bacterium]
VDAFEGEVYVTGRWPHDGVDFTGKRVAVIGTGSSAIQSIPLIADEADELVVFQRTPNFSIPAHNGPPTADKVARFEGRIAEYREEARWSSAGVPRDLAELGALQVDDQTRRARYEQAWEEGTIFSLTGSYNDLFLNPDANETAAEFVRSKIRSIVDDPATAEALCPTTYPIGTKRLCLDTNYYETFNRGHVSLVDLRTEPIERITTTGIELAGAGGSFEFDAIVLATGFDAMTGAIVRVDIAGRDGVPLGKKWADGPKTYLGLMTHGFPNLFMVTGPQSPSVLSNMAVSIEQHVEWITDTLDTLRRDGHAVIEPTELAEHAWVQHTNDFADITLFPQANSWYMGANVPGKARVVLPYVGGVDRYRQACVDVVESGYLGFRRGPAPAPTAADTGEADAGSGSRADVVNDGIIRPLAPDVMVMLDMMAELGVPPLETMSPAAARGFMEASAAMSPPGPDVAEISDGTFPGASGELAYRRYVPAGADPAEPAGATDDAGASGDAGASDDAALPLVVYFHGGGWVLGHATSDDAFCRDLANRSGAVVVSVDYRHAPEHRFPAAHDDAWAALRWAADNADALGGDPDRLAVAGWSAGANLAGHVCHRARDEGGPSIIAQLLVTPVTDHAMTMPSFTDNAEGYVLTASLMQWFFGHYADGDELADPRVSLLRADDLTGLPPAVVVTAEFDPLRDEGTAYADALRGAGGTVTHLRAGGQIHTSLMAVGALATPAEVREAACRALADALR